jgi:excisionase family DNA binding protein
VEAVIIEGRDLSPIEASALLGVSVKTVYRLLDAGKLESYAIGRRLIRIRRESLDDYRRGGRPSK